MLLNLFIKAFSLCGISKPLFNLAPVDNLPYVLEEIGLRMLIVNIESVFPYVNIEQWHEPSWLLISDQILVDRRAILQALGASVVHEPAPPTALH